MAEDVLDELYWVKPEDFTARRTRLAEAAKGRGDPAAAKRISAARKPTTAAWVVNRLALSHTKTKQRLTDLREQLRAAHAAMDGERVRELSREQRKLIDQLTKAAFETAEVTDPPAALRDDVTNTLQAAIADPDVAARLGRLAKAERWSGFGEFGFTAPVSTPARAATAKGKRPFQNPPPDATDDDSTLVAHQQLERARAALAAVERAKSMADAAMSERHAELASARWHHEEARKRLGVAERALRAAEEAHDRAKQASRDAAELVKEARAQLKRRGD